MKVTKGIISELKQKKMTEEQEPEKEKE